MLISVKVTLQNAGKKIKRICNFSVNFGGEQPQWSTTNDRTLTKTDNETVRVLKHIEVKTNFTAQFHCHFLTKIQQKFIMGEFSWFRCQFVLNLALKFLFYLLSSELESFSEVVSITRWCWGGRRGLMSRALSAGSVVVQGSWWRCRRADGIAGQSYSLETVLLDDDESRMISSLVDDVT